MKYAYGLIAAGVLMLFGGSALAAERPVEASACVGCHRLEAPAGDAEPGERTAPPLYYAGNKFREQWLVAWLQNPARIRPAGYYPPAHARTEGGTDVVDEQSLPTHPRLNEAAATIVAQWLMTLRPHDELIEAESGYTPGSVSARMGAIDFVKFKGCGGCHKDTPKYGGVSGPELYTAWQRLQPAFIVSYIRNPVVWNANSLMPVKGLKSSQIHKLASYLRVIGEKEE